MHQLTTCFVYLSYDAGQVSESWLIWVLFTENSLPSEAKSVADESKYNTPDLRGSVRHVIEITKNTDQCIFEGSSYIYFFFKKKKKKTSSSISYTDMSELCQTNNNNPLTQNISSL